MNCYVPNVSRAKWGFYLFVYLSNVNLFNRYDFRFAFIYLKPERRIENAFKTKRGTVKLLYLYDESYEKLRNLTLKKTYIYGKN